ncbi:copper oxidase [Corynebacterium falsenii DSM 44353]|uniref:Multicopper oxidase family protein n=1 Tax=Acidipropionibacterium jensenii TaxID=1749 RepID=A0A3Q9UFL9_9ACTN|nr:MULTISPECIES: multicopper oxidase family protein [Actinomycetes]AHI02845.1 copper oxidase [Corynebacterium falsenii DSM 44353]AZZ40391.1 multicopper oxidase family protein [Acidipropionibacterium jensenii]UBI05635.1 multicopper oxidase family protein [Corynebacterium falsenii]
MNTMSRRQVLLAGLGVASTGALSACGLKTGSSASASGSTSPLALPTQSPLSPSSGAHTVTKTLIPRQLTLDLGGVKATTWAYHDELDTPVLRATAGDLLRIRVDNKLPASTSVHWHGIALRNASDGVPGVTQQPIDPGTRFTYEFVAPDPGTYFFHPHSGVQIDRGLHAPLIIDDPREPGDYDREWIITLDDWTDGIGKSPDDILAAFKKQNGPVSTGMGSMGGMHGSSMPSSGGMGGMGGMDGSSSMPSASSSGMGSMAGSSGMASSPLGDAGDVTYPHYVLNGRVPAAPRTLTGKPGDKVRLRIINAGSDTIFKIALSGHVLTVTHADGYPVTPTKATSVYLAMGERLDATVTLGDGVFVLAAAPEGKKGTPARAIVRTGSGSVPAPTATIAELSSTALLATQLAPAPSEKLPDRNPDQTLEVQLNGQMDPYGWGLNGKKFGEDTPLRATRGQRVRLTMTNMTMMAHPMHIHGHTWALPGSNGLRKDTVLIPPMQTIQADLQADNPGTWMLHCHNIYHAEVGMMTSLRY